MVNLVADLSEAARESLRGEFQLVEPTVWVTDLARRRRWQDANEAFLRHERERGHAEMEHLIAALGTQRPVSMQVARDLVAAAAILNGDGEGSRACVELLGEDALKLTVCNCPVFRRLEETNWRGVTACGSWHRRWGWYEALGIYPSDTVLAESKWGDEACVALIDFNEAAPEALRRWSKPALA